MAAPGSLDLPNAKSTALECGPIYQEFGLDPQPVKRRPSTRRRNKKAQTIHPKKADGITTVPCPVLSVTRSFARVSNPTQTAPQTPAQAAAVEAFVATPAVAIHKYA